jgi:hypothetical protein
MKHISIGSPKPCRAARLRLTNRGKVMWLLSSSGKSPWLPKRGRPKKGSADTDFDRLADALLMRAERSIAKLKLKDRQRSLPHPRLAFPAAKHGHSRRRSMLIAPEAMMQHFTRCDAFSPFADKGFTPAPPPVSSSVELRFAGGKARRTQIGVALFTDGRSASDTGESSLASATRARPEDSGRQEARGKNPLTESLRCAVQYRTGTADGRKMKCAGSA